MPHKDPVSEQRGGRRGVSERKAHRDAEELGEEATQINRGPGAANPELTELGDGISIISGLPTFNAGLRQFLANLLTENLTNATREFGRGEFSQTLAQVPEKAVESQQSVPSQFPSVDVTGSSFFGSDGGSFGARASRGRRAAAARDEGLQGASPGVAGVAAIQAAPAILSVLGNIFGGGPDDPVQAETSGTGFVPQFGDEQSLMAFLQLLSSISGIESEALPIGPSPFHAGMPGASPGAAGAPIQFEGGGGSGQSPMQPPQQAFPVGGGGAGPPNIALPPQPPGGGSVGGPAPFPPGPSILPPAPPPPNGFPPGGGGPGPPNIALPPMPPPPPGFPPGQPPGPNPFIDPNFDPNPTVTDNIPENNAFADIAQQFSLPSFGGDTSVGPTPLQQQSTDFASNFLANNPFTDTANMQGALSDLIGGKQFDSTPQFDALEAISKRRLEEESAQLNEMFGSQGARFGSDIARGQAGLSARFLESESFQRANIAQSSFQNAQDRRLGALPLPGQLGQQQLNQATSAFNIGQANQASQERDLQREMAEFARTQGALFPQLLGFATAGTEGDTTIINPSQLPG